ncbi:MAG: GDCCVxC domain-containing (seleno)protein [Rhodospirillales bacterium]
MTIRSDSTITCPKCGARASETMPTDACLFFYECKACKELLRPNPGHCCVFCSFGDIPCPPVQAARTGQATAVCRP